MAGTLYLVGTPIGNLEDITARARRVLGTVDVVAAEDTRRTGRLLKELGVRVRQVSLFEANEADRVPEVMAALRDGLDVALVTDAGMPSISDPGYRLVTASIEAGFPLDVIPGPSAAVVALVISGLPTDRFVFEGFLPRSGRARRDRLAALASEGRTIVLFESARRVASTLAELAASSLGKRPAALARELTKLHQEVIRGTIEEVARIVAGRELKGEMTIVIGGGRSEDRGSVEFAMDLAREKIAAGATKREAARHARRETGVPGREIYARLVKEGSGLQAAEAGSSRVSRGRRDESSE